MTKLKMSSLPNPPTAQLDYSSPTVAFDRLREKSDALVVDTQNCPHCGKTGGMNTTHDCNAVLAETQLWIPVAGGNYVYSDFGRITVGDAGVWLKQDNCSILLPDDMRLCLCRRTKGPQ